jgi:hypothetical protein
MYSQRLSSTHSKEDNSRTQHNNTTQHNNKATERDGGNGGQGGVHTKNVNIDVQCDFGMIEK